MCIRLTFDIGWVLSKLLSTMQTQKMALNNIQHLGPAWISCNPTKRETAGNFRPSSKVLNWLKLASEYIMKFE